MFRVHLFSIFTIKTPRALAELAPLFLLIVNTLINVTITIIKNGFRYRCGRVERRERKENNTHI